LAGNKTDSGCDYVVAYSQPGYLSPLLRDTYSSGQNVLVRFILADALGQPITDSEGQAAAANCGIEGALDGQVLGCATYESNTDSFTLNVKIPKATTAGNHLLTLRVKAGADILNESSQALRIR
jgi:hypothetical protein